MFLVRQFTVPVLQILMTSPAVASRAQVSIERLCMLIVERLEEDRDGRASAHVGNEVTTADARPKALRFGVSERRQGD